MAVIGEAFVNLRPNTAGFAEQSTSGILGPLKKVAIAGAAILGGIFAVKQGVDFVGKLVEDGEALTKQQKLVATALQTTGNAAHVNSDQLKQFAESQAGVTGQSAQAITKLQQVLLRFTGIRNEVGANNDIFNRAEVAIQNVSAALGKGLQPVALSVGRALNDPANAMSALRRVQVSFTEDQKNLVKSMVESGNTIGAQGFILDTLTQRYGGAAAAAATFTEKLHAEIANTKEIIGQSLEPAVGAVVSGLLPVVPQIGSVITKAVQGIIPAITPILRQVGPLLQSVVSAAAPIVVSLGGTLARVVGGLAPVVGQVAGVIRALTPALAPIGKVLAALATAVGKVATPAIQGFALIVQKVVTAIVPPFTRALAALSPVIVSIAKLLGGAFGDALESLSGPLGEIAASLSVTLADAIQALAPALQPLISGFVALGGTFAETATALLRALVPAFEAIIDAIVPVLPAIAQVATVVGGALLSAVRAIAPFMIQFGEAIGTLITTGINALLPSLPALVDAFVSLAQAFADTVVAVTPLLPPLIQLATQVLENIGAPTISALASAFGELAKALVPIIDVVTPLITKLAGMPAVVDAVVFAFLGFKAIQGVKTIIDGTRQAIDSFQATAQAVGIGANIIQALPALTEGAKNARAATSDLSSEVATATSTFAGFLQIVVLSKLETLHAILVALGGSTTFLATAGGLAAAAYTFLIVKLEDAGGLFESLGGIIQFTTQQFTALPLGIVRAVQNIGDLQGVFSSLVDVVFVFAAGISHVTDGLIDAGGAFAVLGRALQVITIPFTILPRAIHALIDNFAAVTSAVSGFATAIPGFFEALPGQILGALDSIGRAVAGLPALIAAAFAALPGLVPVIADALDSLGHVVADAFGNLGGLALSALGSVGPNILEGLKAAAVAVVNALPSIFAGIFFFFVELPAKIALGLAFLGGFLIGAFAKAFLELNQFAVTSTVELTQTIVQGVLNGLDALGRAVVAGIQAVPAALDALGHTVADFFTSLPQTVPAALDALGHAVVDGLDAIGRGTVAVFTGLFSRLNSIITESIPDFAAAAQSLAGSFGGGLTSSILGALDSIGRATQSIASTLLFDVGETIFEGLLSGLESARDNLTEFFQDTLPNTIIDATGDAKDWLVDVGPGIVEGLIEGALGALDAIGHFVVDLVAAFVDGVKSGFDIGSPSRIMMPLGADILLGIVQGAIGAVGALVSFVASIPGLVLGAIGDFVTTFAPIGVSILQGIVSGAEDAFQIVNDFFGGIPGRILSVLGGIGGGLIGIGQEFIQAIVQGAEGNFGALLSFFVSLPARLLSIIPGGSALVSIGHNLIQSIVTGSVQNLVAVISFFTSLPGRIISTVQTGVLSVIGSALMNAIGSGAQAAFGAVNAFFGGIPGRILSTLGNVASRLLPIGVGFVQGIISGAESRIGGVVSFFTNIPNTIKNAVGNPFGLLRDIGENVIEGLIQGIQNKVGSITSIVKGIGSKVVGAFKSVFGISSPSTITKDIGINLSQGLSLGIDAGGSLAVAQARVTGSKVIDGIKEGAKSAGINLSGDFAQTLSDAMAHSTATATGFVEAGSAFVSDLQNSINQAITDHLDIRTAIGAFAQTQLHPAGGLAADDFNEAFTTIVNAEMGQGLSLPQAVADFARTGIKKAFDPSALQDFQSATLNLQSQYLSLQESLKATGAIDTVSHSFNLNSQAGVSAAQSAASYAKSIFDTADANRQAGGDIAQAAAAAGLQATALLQTGRSAGVSDDAMKRFIATALGIPPEKVTNVKTDADFARVIVDNLHGRLNALPHVTPANVNVQVHDEQLQTMREEIRKLADNTVTVRFKGVIIKSPAREFDSFSDAIKYLGAGVRDLLAAEAPGSLSVVMSQADVKGVGLTPFGQVGGTLNRLVQSGLTRSSLSLPPVIVPTVQDVSMQIHAATVDVEGGSEHSLSTAGSVITQVVQATVAPLTLNAQVDVSVPTAQLQAAAVTIRGSLSELISGATSGLPPANNFVQSFGQKFTDAANAVSKALGVVNRAQAALHSETSAADIVSAQKRLAFEKDVLDQVAGRLSASDLANLTGSDFLEHLHLVDAAQRRLQAAQNAHLHDVLVDAKAVQDAQASLAKAQEAAAGAASITAFIHGLQSQANAAKQFIADLDRIRKVAPQLAADLAKAGPDAAGALATAFAKSSSQAKAAETALIRANGAATNITNFLTKQFGPLLGDTGTQVGQSLADGIANGLLGVLPAARAIVGQLKDVLGDINDVTVAPTIAAQVSPVALAPNPVPVFTGASNQPAVVQLDVTLTNPDGTTTEFVTSPITVVPGTSLVQRVQAQTRAQ